MKLLKYGFEILSFFKNIFWFRWKPWKNVAFDMDSNKNWIKDVQHQKNDIFPIENYNYCLNESFKILCWTFNNSPTFYFVFCRNWPELNPNWIQIPALNFINKNKLNLYIILIHFNHLIPFKDYHKSKYLCVEKHE